MDTRARKACLCHTYVEWFWWVCILIHNFLPFSISHLQENRKECIQRYFLIKFISLCLNRNCCLMCYVLLCVSIYISTMFLWLKIRYPRKDLWQHQCICLFFQQIISASSSFLYFTYLFINVGTVGSNFWSLKMFVFFVFQNYY